jgi:hypothetical protein
MVNKIEVQRIMISTNPRSGDLSPKNSTDQREFRINWIMKRRRARLTRGFSMPFRQTRKAEIPIRK